MGITPFKVVYGLDPKVLTYDFNENYTPLVSTLLQQRDLVLQQLKLNISHAKECMKHFANTKYIDILI